MQWYYCTSFNCLWVPPCLRISAGSAACRFSQSQSELPRASSGGSGGLLPNPFVVESSHNGCAFTYIPNCDSLPGTLGWHLTLATSFIPVPNVTLLRDNCSRRPGCGLPLLTRDEKSLRKQFPSFALSPSNSNESASY